MIIVMLKQDSMPILPAVCVCVCVCVRVQPAYRCFIINVEQQYIERQVN